MPTNNSNLHSIVIKKFSFKVLKIFFPFEHINKIKDKMYSHHNKYKKNFW